MNETHGKLSTMCGLFALWMVLVLVGAPIAARADKAPGYEKYQEGMKAMLATVSQKGRGRGSGAARAVQNPVADMISFPLQNNTNFNFGPLERTQNVLIYSARHSRRCDREVAHGHPHHSAPGFATRVSARSGPGAQSGQRPVLGVLLAQGPKSLAWQLAMGSVTGHTTAHVHARPSGGR